MERTSIGVVLVVVGLTVMQLGSTEAPATTHLTTLRISPKPLPTLASPLTHCPPGMQAFLEKTSLVTSWTLQDPT
jgi:hypothetical protein